MLSLFIVDSIPEISTVSLPEDEARHAITSLRITVGEHISITDGAGSRADVEVKEVTKREVRGEILNRTFEPQSPVELIVVQALTKGDRARETIELLCEGGATSIVPWSASRSIGKWNEDSLTRWQSWAHEATKQSRRNWIPEISPCQSTEEILQLVGNVDCVLLFHEGGGERIAEAIPAQVKRIAIIIGPEGGIDEDEVRSFISAGATKVRMGTPVLRSAHAGLAALSAIQTLTGLW